MKFRARAYGGSFSKTMVQTHRKKLLWGPAETKQRRSEVAYKALLYNILAGEGQTFRMTGASQGSLPEGEEERIEPAAPET